MSDLKINGRKFVSDGKDFFYLADTVWSAFTNITMEEWEYYLNQRKFQGFNVLQINVLPQWDRCSSNLVFDPFPTHDHNTFQFTSFNDKYFLHAKEMCQVATKKGFKLALVMLWSNYVPGTWASNLISDNIMPFGFLEGLVKKIYSTFDEFNPIYIISGDTDFDSDESIHYYEYVLDLISKLSPDTLKTFHIKGRYDKIPERLANKIDFYTFQSGHNSQYQYMSYKLANYFYNHYAPKPIVNAEPCYEQMGYSRNMYGRFRQKDIRQAAWSSLLSGASAGVTYGAHGVWNWQIQGKKSKIQGEGFDTSMPWEDAIKFPGAWDYGFIKYLFQTYRIGELIPFDIIADKSEEIRCAHTADGNLIIIYLPTNTSLTLNGNFKSYDFQVIDLETKNVLTPNVLFNGSKTVIQMHNFFQDAVIIGRKS